MTWEKKSKISMTNKSSDYIKKSYCLKYRKNTQSKNAECVKIKKPGRIMFSWICSLCNSKNQN